MDSDCIDSDGSLTRNEKIVSKDSSSEGPFEQPDIQDEDMDCEILLKVNEKVNDDERAKRRIERAKRLEDRTSRRNGASEKRQQPPKTEGKLKKSRAELRKLKKVEISKKKEEVAKRKLERAFQRQIKQRSSRLKIKTINSVKKIKDSAAIKTPKMLFKAIYETSIKKKNGNNTLVSDGALGRCWQLMSEELKKKFIDAFLNYSKDDVQKQADLLKDLIPPSILKKRKLHNAQPSYISPADSMIQIMEENLQFKYDPENAGYQGQNDDDCLDTSAFLQETAPSMQSASPERHEHYEMSERIPCVVELPPPPKPPSVMNVKQLYAKVNEQNENKPPWDDLGKSDKYQYYRALTILKQDYMRKYTSYLHSLSSEQLHKHRLEVMLSQLNN